MTRFQAPQWAALVLAAALGACDRAAAPAPETHIVLGTGGLGGAFYALGPPLARYWTEHIPGVEVQADTGGSGVNVEALQTGPLDVAFAQGDIVYAAYSRGTTADRRPHTGLRAMAVLWMNTVHVAVPVDSPVRTVDDLRGRRVAVTSRGGGTETLARVVLDAYGLSYAAITPQFGTFVESIDGLRSGGTDAAFVVAGVPAVAITELSQRPGIRLLPISRDHIATMRAEYPFLQPLIVPANTYKGIGRDVDTLGVATLLICRRDLDERLVYQMTKQLFEAVPRLAAAHPAARLIDPEQAPATPIPLHPGAARYYREREITR